MTEEKTIARIDVLIAKRSINAARHDFGGTLLHLVATLAEKNTPAPYETINHEPCDRLIQFTWGLDEQDRRHETVMWGRTFPTDDEGWEWEEGWTAERRQQAQELGARWHLNGMLAACAHMPPDAHERWDRKETVECAAGSGYKYGHAWLVEPIPDDTLAQLRATFGL